MKCIVCNSQDWQQLPSPLSHSMTTSGMIIDEPLSKAHCTKCGNLQRSEVRLLGETDYYETKYNFYSRPGADIFDKSRYVSMAEWIIKSIGSFKPRTILDAGCGRGWMLNAMSEYFPDTILNGIEPSIKDSSIARSLGYDVITGKVDHSLKMKNKYDLIYSTNVIEHTINPKEFLESLSFTLAENGIIVIICPDSTKPSAELMFSDQNYSFIPSNIHEIVKSIELQLVSWKLPPDHYTLREKQLFIIAKTINVSKYFTTDQYIKIIPDDLYAARKDYIMSYVKCDKFLSEQIQNSKAVVNFGTSTWAWLISAYCPNYWGHVDYCAIDNGTGDFMGKAVIDYKTLSPSDSLSIVICASPNIQQHLKTRFENDRFRAVTWNHIIAC
jgi:2-polyprenyl-3-methyl-5-hydroxy-6-metoxy-1,4-benzoquinol methylase